MVARGAALINQAVSADQYSVGSGRNIDAIQRPREGLLMFVWVCQRAISKAVALNVQHLPTVGVMRPTAVGMRQGNGEIPCVTSALCLRAFNDWIIGQCGQGQQG
ncbi:hypothetical protein JI58_04840 [Marinosulfonomonas sp. PRT-SC04]|nr:hypothetical protein JI58_04840 [Marinosulfonomonas sp. PRT-SC04]